MRRQLLTVLLLPHERQLNVQGNILTNRIPTTEVVATFVSRIDTIPPGRCIDPNFPLHDYKLSWYCGVGVRLQQVITLYLLGMSSAAKT
jgi:hypothetical protein